MITPAQNFLKQKKVKFQTYEYECTVDHDFGHFAARALGRDENEVFKTIILHHDKTYVTCVVPVNAMISMKNTARLLKLKSLEMTDPKVASNITGYVIGGISPFGQKRRTITVLAQSALDYPEILVSGGRRGFSIGISPQDLIAVTGAVTGDIVDHGA